MSGVGIANLKERSDLRPQRNPVQAVGGNPNESNNPVQAVGGKPNESNNPVQALKLNKVKINNSEIKKYIKNGTAIPTLNIKNNNKVSNNNNRLKNYYKINSTNNLNNENTLKSIQIRDYTSEKFHELFSKTGKFIQQMAASNKNKNNNRHRVIVELSLRWDALTGAFVGDVFKKFPKSMVNNNSKYANMPHGGFFARKMGVYKTSNNKARIFRERFNKIKGTNGKSILNNEFIKTTESNGLPVRGKVLILILIFINNFLKKHKNIYNRAGKVYKAINKKESELALERGKAINTVSGFNNMVMNVVESINKLVKETEKNSPSSPASASTPASTNASNATKPLN